MGGSLCTKSERPCLKGKIFKKQLIWIKYKYKPAEILDTFISQYALEISSYSIFIKHVFSK